MGHLRPQDLARLVSETPSREEEGHLASCPVCRAELEALRTQTEGLGALPDLRPPPGDWETLEGRLVAEGLIHSSGMAWKASRWRSSGWIQAAAALVLFVGGTALGARVSREPALARGEDTSPPNLELVPVGSQAQPAGNITEAAAAVRLAERQFIDALVQYRQLLDSQGQPSYIGNPTSRLAALQGIVAAGRAGVQQAPADPFMNGVLVSALAEQEALLRNASLTTREGVF